MIITARCDGLSLELIALYPDSPIFGFGLGYYEESSRNDRAFSQLHPWFIDTVICADKVDEPFLVKICCLCSAPYPNRIKNIYQVL